jgi:hypothetical protein
MDTRKISPELKPVLEQLQAEGFKVYTYNCNSNKDKEINSLYWYENGRVLNIQPNSWRDEKYARDRFNLSVSYIPSCENGSGCGLSLFDTGDTANDVLSFRERPTWVRGVENYKSMEHFLKRETILEFYEIK